MKKVRRFLKDNKIFFETVVMVSLTAIGIFVSITANSILQKQTNIEAALAKPIINVEAVYNDNGDVIQQLNITNDGSAVRNVDIEVIPYYFLFIEKQAGDGGYSMGSLLLPIEDTIYPVFKLIHNNSTTGTLGTISSSDETALYVKDMADFQDYVNGNLTIGLRVCLVSIQ